MLIKTDETFLLMDAHIIWQQFLLYIFLDLFTEAEWENLHYRSIFQIFCLNNIIRRQWTDDLGDVWAPLVWRDRTVWLLCKNGTVIISTLCTAVRSERGADTSCIPVRWTPGCLKPNQSVRFYLSFSHCCSSDSLSVSHLAGLPPDSFYPPIQSMIKETSGQTFTAQNYHKLTKWWSKKFCRYWLDWLGLSVYR